MKTQLLLLAGFLLAGTAGCAGTAACRRAVGLNPDIRALLAAAEAGSVVEIPRGTYLLDRALEISREGITLRCAPGTRILVSDPYQNVINVRGAAGVRIENAFLSHHLPLKEYECHGAVIDIENSRGVAIVNCDIHGSGAIGVYARRSSDLLIENCRIRENTFNALYLHGCRDVVLRSNLIENNGNLFQVYDTDGFEASDNLIRNNGGYWRERDPVPGPVSRRTRAAAVRHGRTSR